VKQPTEAQTQAAFFSWLALHEKKHPVLGLFFAVPNGSFKSPAARGLFKRTGLKAGVPDVHLPIPTQRHGGFPLYSGLWIEFKTSKGNPSDVQIAWQTKLRLVGHRVEICRSWTEAANIVIEYLNLPMKKIDSDS
jgi:hypothetical protein